MYVHAKSVESVAALMTLVVTISLVGTTLVHANVLFDEPYIVYSVYVWLRSAGSLVQIELQGLLFKCHTMHTTRGALRTIEAFLTMQCTAQLGSQRTALGKSAIVYNSSSLHCSRAACATIVVS